MANSSRIQEMLLVKVARFAQMIRSEFGPEWLSVVQDAIAQCVRDDEDSILSEARLEPSQDA